MTVESVSHIADLDDTYPAASDDPSEGDDHIRNIKTALSTDFANIDGAVTSTDSDLNILSGAAVAGVTSTEFQYLNGVTSAIQTQIDAKEASQTAASDAEMVAGTVTSTRSMTPAQVHLSYRARLVLRTSGGTETLTAAASRGKLNITTTASTLTLPLLSAMTDGDLVGFALDADVGVTVQRQSTDELSWPGAAALNSVKMTKFGDYLILQADTTNSQWRVVSEGISGPSFLAEYEGAGQSIGTGTATKLQFNTEVSDSHGDYDPTTNYRFTPTIPGWYMVTASAYINAGSGARGAAILYKNGSEYAYGQRSYTTTDGVYHVSYPVYLNGSTDYVECYGISIDTSGTFDDTLESKFTAVRIR